MKIGIDVHGVIDKYPVQFSHMTTAWLSKGYEVHIITGQPLDDVMSILVDANIYYSHFYSIVECHMVKDTHMWKDDNDTWWMAGDIWTPAKGKYAEEVGLDIHFDDSRSYCDYFPRDCSYVNVGSNYEKIFNLFLQL